MQSLSLPRLKGSTGEWGFCQALEAYVHVCLRVYISIYIYMCIHIIYIYNIIYVCIHIYIYI